MPYPVAREILQFWREIGPEGWYAGGDDLDNRIRARFADRWAEAREGAHAGWTVTAEGALAYLVLTDQIPRNIFRNDARSFATDERARQAALVAIRKGLDLEVQGDIRQFFYLPFMHAEGLVDQYRCVALFAARMPEAAGNLLHARAHREVIRRFGRFPYRNEALGRTSTPQEKAFMAEGGYGAVVRELGG